MAMNENSADISFAPIDKNTARGAALHPLHEAAMRIAGMGLGMGAGMGAGLARPAEKTRDLVSLLLSHGARAWRQVQPEAGIHLHVGMRSGRAPVRIRIR